MKIEFNIEGFTDDYKIYKIVKCKHGKNGRFSYFKKGEYYPVIISSHGYYYLLKDNLNINNPYTCNSSYSTLLRELFDLKKYGMYDLEIVENVKIDGLTIFFGSEFEVELI